MEKRKFIIIISALLSAMILLAVLFSVFPSIFGVNFGAAFALLMICVLETFFIKNAHRTDDIGGDRFKRRYYRNGYFDADGYIRFCRTVFFIALVLAIIFVLLGIARWIGILLGQVAETDKGFRG